MLWPALETVDIAIFGTMVGVVHGGAAGGAGGREHDAVACRLLCRRAAIIGFTRAVPDLVWALLFVTAVGLGPFPGGAGAGGAFGRHARPAVRRNDRAHGHGADRCVGADRRQPHAGVHATAWCPTVLPALLGIALYRLDENIRSSLVLGFVGAGGIGFQLLTAMNLFQYREVSLLLMMTFVIVLGAERMSAALRERLA